MVASRHLKIPHDSTGFHRFHRDRERGPAATSGRPQAVFASGVLRGPATAAAAPAAAVVMTLTCPLPARYLEAATTAPLAAGMAAPATRAADASLQRRWRRRPTVGTRSARRESPAPAAALTAPNPGTRMTAAAEMMSADLTAPLMVPDARSASARTQQAATAMAVARPCAPSLILRFLCAAVAPRAPTAPRLSHPNTGPADLERYPAMAVSWSRPNAASASVAG